MDIYLFPHGDNEFEDEGRLAKYLNRELKTVRGPAIYRVITAGKYRRPKPGDKVVFHKNRLFVGEGVVLEDVRLYLKVLRIDGGRYEGEVTFDPKTVRVYKRPIPFDVAERSLGKKINSQGVKSLSFRAYSAIRRALA